MVLLSTLQRHADGNYGAFGGKVRILLLKAQAVDSKLIDARCGSYYHHFIALVQIVAFEAHLGYRQFAEPIGDAAQIDLYLARLGAIDITPFSQPCTLVITVPKTAVEHFRK